MSARNPVSFCLLALSAGLAVTSPAPAIAADDCRLAITTDASVLAFGQSTQVDVFAHFPASAFAFASAEFDVLATAPTWQSVSGGLVAGGSVLGISESQMHLPGSGVLADPSNPLRIWNGVWTPAAPGPKLIQFETVPGDFSYYPSNLTSSSVPCAAAPWRSYLWVDPMPVGSIGHIAPADGTSLEQTGPTDFLATAEPGESVLIGQLLPAIQKVRAHFGWPAQPDTFRYSLLAGPESPGEARIIEEYSLNFAKIPPATPGGSDIFDLTIETPVQYGVIDKSICRWTRPGEPDLCFFTTEEPIQTDRVPDAIEAHLIKGGPNESDQIVFILRSDEPRWVHLPGVYEGYTREPIVVRLMPAFMKLEGVEGTVTESSALPGPLGLSIGSPCAADLNNDGVLDFFDVQAFLNHFSAGDQEADFNLDGRLNFFDVQSYLHAFADGCP